VVSGIPDAGAAIGLLSPNQQVSIGLASNGVFATVADRITDCTLPGCVRSALDLTGFRAGRAACQPDHHAHPARRGHLAGKRFLRSLFRHLPLRRQ
jgi:hypothetical protein